MSASLDTFDDVTEIFDKLFRRFRYESEWNRKFICCYWQFCLHGRNSFSSFFQVRSSASILKSQALSMPNIKGALCVPLRWWICNATRSSVLERTPLGRTDDTTYDFLARQLEDEGLALSATYLGVVLRGDPPLPPPLQLQPPWHSTLNILCIFVHIWHIVHTLQILHIWHRDIYMCFQIGAQVHNAWLICSPMP